MDEKFEVGDRVVTGSGATGKVLIIGTTTFLEGVHEPAVWVDLDGPRPKSAIVRPDDLSRL